MASVKKKAPAGATAAKRAGAKKAPAKKAPAKKLAARSLATNEVPSSPEDDIHSDWLVTLGSMTLQQLVQVGIIERETSKHVPPASLRMALSDDDITRIVEALATRLAQPDN